MIPQITRALLVLALTLTSACSPREPEVRLDSPEETARSVGRLLCAEHEQRIEAIDERLDAAIVIQQAKDKLLTAGAKLEEINERLARFADFFKAHRDELRACKVALIDKTLERGGTQVLIAMELRVKDWSMEGDGLALTPHETPLVLTLTELEGEWRVTASSQPLGLPGGALRSLLD